MDAASLIAIALRTSVFLLVFALGLGASLREALSLLRRPGQLVRSLLAMNVAMPLLAIAVAFVFDLHHAVEVTLIALAVSPVPPILPKKQLKAGGSEPYTVGLLFATALFAVISLPFSVELAGKVFHTQAYVPFSTVAAIVAMTVMVPLFAGIGLRQVAPAFAQRIARPVSLGATVTLFVGVAPVVYFAFPAAITLVGNGTLLALAAFVLAGLAIGHLLGGPEPENRVVLALATATRHPGVAIAVAHAAAPAEKLVMGAVLLYVIVGLVLSAVYLALRRRQEANKVDSAA